MADDFTEVAIVALDKATGRRVVFHLPEAIAVISGVTHFADDDRIDRAACTRPVKVVGHTTTFTLTTDGGYTLYTRDPSEPVVIEGTPAIESAEILDGEILDEDQP